MQIKDDKLAMIISKISTHYNDNISTRFIRPLISSILYDQDMEQKISYLTERTETIIAQGIYLDELYHHILAFARFVFLVRKEVIPNIKSYANSYAKNDKNKVFRNMAYSNLPANVSMLSTLIHDLYVQALELDKQTRRGKGLLCEQIIGVSDIPRYLDIHKDP